MPRKRLVIKERSDWAKRAIVLSWFTIFYNLLEGVASITFGVGDESIALAGFGVDSFIEVASAVLVLWRFRGEEMLGTGLSLERERRATAGIGVLFLILAAITLVASITQIVKGGRPATTLPGTVVALVSLSFMFFLWSSKRKVAQALDSSTVMKDAACSLACIKLSGVLLAGSVLYLIVPTLWWVDSVAALILAGFIGLEGWETLEAARDSDFAGGCGCSGREGKAETKG